MPPATRQTPRFVDPEDQFQIFTTPGENFAKNKAYKHITKLLVDDFSEIRKLLGEELRVNSLYYRAWKEAEKLLPTKEVQDHLPIECRIAVIAYTLETPRMYADFNAKCRKLREESDWINFPYKSLYILLARSIHGIDGWPPVTYETHYRVVNCQVKNIKMGKSIIPGQFLSCSLTREEALKFVNCSNPTLIIIEGAPVAAIGNQKYSAFPNEREVLFFPWNNFKVTKIDKNKTPNEVSLEVRAVVDKKLPYSGQYKDCGIVINDLPYNTMFF